MASITIKCLFLATLTITVASSCSKDSTEQTTNKRDLSPPPAVIDKNETEVGADDGNDVDANAHIKTAIVPSPEYIMSRSSSKKISGLVGGGDVTGATVHFDCSDGNTRIDTTLDQKGLFTSDVDICEGNLTIRKFGFAPYYHQVKLNGDPSLQSGALYIVMKKATLQTDYAETNQGIAMDTDNGYHVSIPAGALRYQDGGKVTKKIRISIVEVDSRSDTGFAPPNTATVTLLDGSKTSGVLVTSGMMFIHIEDEDGILIQDVDPENGITLRYPIPESDITYARSRTGQFTSEDGNQVTNPFPYWYFNHETFSWENVADKDGNMLMFAVVETEDKWFYQVTGVTKIY